MSQLIIIIIIILVMRCPELTHTHTEGGFISHTTIKLMFIQVRMDHKDSKALSHNITAFSGLNLETFD